MKGKDNLRDLGIDRRTVADIIGWDVRMFTGFIWLRIGTRRRLFCMW
jgi:hypothetical protein